MEITLIGIVVIILSTIAFFKNEDKLLELAMFFSVFTAAMAIGIQKTTTPIWPFEIPIIFWILKQFINLITGKIKVDINKNSIRKKLLIAFIVFTCVMIAGEIWLYISNLNVSYYDYKFYKDMNITFTSRNITQPIRLMLFIIFAILLIIKNITKEQIIRIIKAFEYGCIFALFWGCVQYFINMFELEYPAFLFNNNPYVSQGYEQRVGNLTRITSIASEPPVFGFTVLTFLPLIFSRYEKVKFEKNKSKYIYIGITCLTIILGILSTSSTFYLGFSALIFIFLMYKFFDKNNTFTNKFMYAVKVVLVILGLVIISLGLLFLPKVISQIGKEKINTVQNSNIGNANTVIEQKTIENNNIINDETIINTKPQESVNENNVVRTNEEIIIETEEVEVNNKEEINNVIKTLCELTINKLKSGSGQIRLNQEKVGIQHFMKSPILGLGYGTIATYTLFVNVLVNFGILGAINFIAILFLCIISIKRNSIKDKFLAEGIIFSIICICICFASSISDLTYLFFWGIMILGYKYFADSDDEKLDNDKERLIIGIDGRGLDLKRTGITTYISEVIKRLNEIDHENKYYIYSNKDVILDFELNDNFEIRRYKCKKGTLGYYFKLPKILKQDNVDVLWGTQHCLPMRNSFTNDIKFVLTVHDLAIHKLKTVGELKNTIIQRLFLKRSCKHANVIMADSKATKDDIIEIFKIKEEKIKVVYLGTNFTGEYNVTKKQEEEIENKFNIKNKNYLFFLSTIEPRKNLDTAIRAFEKYKEEKKSDLKFIISGGIGWKCEKTLEMIDNSKYKEDIIRTGYITKEEKEYFFKNCKAFLYPSLYEGFGLPVLEAMQKGAVVITSNISSIPEVGGDAALYLNNVYDVNELEALIERALTLDEESKKTIIQKGYEQVKKFTWEDCAKEVLEILSK